jgi:hypothetical protein
MFNVSTFIISERIVFEDGFLSFELIMEVV